MGCHKSKLVPIPGGLSSGIMLGVNHLETKCFLILNCFSLLHLASSILANGVKKSDYYYPDNQTKIALIRILFVCLCVFRSENRSLPLNRNDLDTVGQTHGQWSFAGTESIYTLYNRGIIIYLCEPLAPPLCKIRIPVPALPGC